MQPGASYSYRSLVGCQMQSSCVQTFEPALRKANQRQLSHHTEIIGNCNQASLGAMFKENMSLKTLTKALSDR